MRCLRPFMLCLILPALPLAGQWLQKTIELPSTPGPKVVTYAAATGRWFIGGEGSYVMVLDPSLRVTARIRTGADQRALCPNEFGSRIYVACAESDTIAVLDVLTQSVVANIEVPFQPSILTYNPSQRKLYCARNSTDFLAVIDCVTNTVIRSLYAGRGPTALCYGETGHRVYVASQQDDRVAVIDGTSDSVVKLVDVGYLPTALCYSRASNKVYCANYGDSTISVLDCGSDSVLATLHVGVRPSFLVWSELGNKVYCASKDDDKVVVVDCVRDSVVARVAVGDGPVALACALADSLVYCADYGSNDVKVIDGVRDSVIATISVGQGPAALAVSPSHRLCVADRASSDVQVIDCLTNTPLDTFGVSTAPSAVCYDSISDRVFCADEAGWVHVIDCVSDSIRVVLPVGAGANALCLNPAGRRVFSANRDADNVTVIDAAGDSVIRSTQCGDWPVALCYNATSNRVYCANSYGNTVSVLDGTTGNLIATVPAGAFPHALCHNTTNNKVYCVNVFGSSVTVIDGSTNGVLATVPVGRYPYGICYNPLDNRIYCTNSSDNSVSVIDGVTNLVVATVGVGSGPVTLCHNPAHDFVYCGNYGGGSTTVIDCTTHTAIDTIVTSGCPCVLRDYPTSDRVYAANTDENSVSIIHCGVNEAFWEVEVPDEPVDLAVVTPHDRVYVACFSGECVVVLHDVAVDVSAAAVVAPFGGYEGGDTVRPAGWWRNYGNGPASFQAWMSLFNPSGRRVYAQAVNVELATGGDSVISSFPPCTLDTSGYWTVRCSTFMTGDMEPADDTVAGRCYVYPPDIGVRTIIAPSGKYDTGALAVPRVIWHNWSGLSVGFTAWCRVRNPTGALVYSESIRVAALAWGRDTLLVFPGFHVSAMEGTWTSRCSTASVGDENAWNDTLSRPFTVEVGGISPVPGWCELKDVPLSPSGKPVKDGGWLAYMDGDECVYAAKGNKTGDFFRYDPLADTWHLLAPIPKGNEGKLPGKGAAATTDADRFLYATKGNNTLGFWRYDIERDGWRQLADVPLGISNKKVKGGTDLAYVDFDDTPYVYLLKGYKNEFYRYNVESNAWAVLEGAPVGSNAKWDKGSWMVYDEDCVLYAHKARFHELWKYDIEDTCWASDSLSSMPQVGRSGRKKKLKDGGCAAWLDDEIYVLKGGNTQEFWKYDVEANAWAELDTIPSYGSTGKKKKVKSGADITSDGSDWFFVLKGNRSREFWRYIVPWSAAARVPEREGVMAATAELGPTSIEILPSHAVSGFVNVRYVLPSAGRFVAEFYDVSGRLKATRRIAAGRSGSAALDLRGLTAGVYLVRLAASGYSTTARLVIARSRGR
jgi:YVTN family beta-propeller protein